MHEHKAGAEHGGLLVRLLGEPAAADAAGESKVVADQRARPGLAADASGVHDDDVKPLRGAVDGGRQARRPGAHHHHVEGALVEALRSAGGQRDLGVRRIAERAAVGQHHQRQPRIGAGLGDQIASLVGVGAAERVRHGAGLEHGSQLVCTAGRPLVADDLHGVGNPPLVAGPFQQEAGDRLMKDLVRGRGGLEHEVVDAPERQRHADGVRADGVGPRVGRDEQHALRMRV